MFSKYSVIRFLRNSTIAIGISTVAYLISPKIDSWLEEKEYKIANKKRHQKIDEFYNARENMKHSYIACRTIGCVHGPRRFPASPYPGGPYPQPFLCAECEERNNTELNYITSRIPVIRHKHLVPRADYQKIYNAYMLPVNKALMPKEPKYEEYSL